MHPQTSRVPVHRDCDDAQRAHVDRPTEACPTLLHLMFRFATRVLRIRTAPCCTKRRMRRKASAQSLRCTTPTAIQTAVFNPVIKETAMQWTTPAYTDLRFGFEITMYIANR